MAVTLWYRAIEILLGWTHYNEKIDMWAVGCVFYEMDHGKPMFASDSEVEVVMNIYKSLGFPKDNNFPGGAGLPDFNNSVTFCTSPTTEIDDMYRRLFSYDYTKRPSADDILQTHFSH